MHHLSPTTDLRFLVDREVVQIGVGANETQVVFDQSVTIGIMGRFRLDGELHEPCPGAGIALVSLLGKTIRSAEVHEGRHLKLTFPEGTILLVLEDDDPYESYTITSSSVTIVV